MSMKFELYAKVVLKFLVALAIPLAVGGLSGALTSDGIDEWYQYLEKPAFNPPNYLFGIVWPVLYALMGVSLFLIWVSPPHPRKRIAYVAFSVQLALNFFWSFIFFNFREPAWALAEIVVLWVCILWMIRTFYLIRKWAAVLQIPYLLWVTFATVLNAAIWLLN